MAISGLLKKAGRASVATGKGAVSLGKQAAVMTAYQAVQDKVLGAIGIDPNSKTASFLSGAVPTLITDAGRAMSFAGRMRSALLWGGLSLGYDALMGSSADAADEARKATDMPFMPQTQKVVDMHAQFAAVMQHAEDERAMANTHPTISNGLNANDHMARVVALLNKSQSIRKAADNAHINDLADRWDKKDLAGMTSAEMSVARMASGHRQAVQRSAALAQKEAAEHNARIGRIANMLKGKGPDQRMATLRKGLAASKALHAHKGKHQSKAKGSRHVAKSNHHQGRMHNPAQAYQHKAMWTDKNGKVYHRQMKMPKMGQKFKDRLADARKPR